MWNLPGSGIELRSPALAGRFFTAEPPGKPNNVLFVCQLNSSHWIISYIKCFTKHWGRYISFKWCKYSGHNFVSPLMASCLLLFFTWPLPPALPPVLKSSFIPFPFFQSLGSAFTFPFPPWGEESFPSLWPTGDCASFDIELRESKLKQTGIWQNE